MITERQFSKHGWFSVEVSPATKYHSQKISWSGASFCDIKDTQEFFNTLRRAINHARKEEKRLRNK